MCQSNATLPSCKLFYCTIILILKHCLRGKSCLDGRFIANYQAATKNDCMKYCKETEGCIYYEWSTGSNCMLIDKCDTIGLGMNSFTISHIDCNKE